MLSCVAEVAAPSGPAGRRDLQYFEHFTNYGAAGDVEPEAIPCHVGRMLLNGPGQYQDRLEGKRHRKNLHKGRGQRCAVTGGGPPDPDDDNYELVGGPEAQAKKFMPLQYIEKLPASPDEYRRKYPQMHQAVFA